MQDTTSVGGNGKHERPVDWENTGRLEEEDEGLPIWTEEIGATLKAKLNSIRELRGRRDAINADVNAELAELNALGIPSEAVKRALKDEGMEEARRARVDYWHLHARRMLGLPVQLDMFSEE